MKNNGFLLVTLYMLLVIGWVTGEVKCIIKLSKCDWEKPYSAEVIYIVGFCTGTGGIIGYFDIGQ